jgi:predicted nucleotidyltransferase component of viral defense system
MKDFLNQIVGRQPNDLVKRSVVREYLQARILQSLQENGAFLNWVFLGGTALRFLYSIPRYSEDLDFSLMESRHRLDFRRSLLDIKKRMEAEAYGVEVKVNDRKTVNSAFVRFPGLLYELNLSARPAETLAVKLELDTNPPAGAGLSTTIFRRFITLNLPHYNRASLLAGKLHAILSRPYTKGRDLYDLVWFLSDPGWPPPNWTFLNNALEQTGWSRPEVSPSNFGAVAAEGLSAVKWRNALADVRPFLEREAELSLLTRDNCLRLIDQAAERYAKGS